MSKNLLVSGSARSYIMEPSGKIVWEQKKCGNIHRSMKHGDWIYYSNANLFRVNIKTGAKELFYQPSPKEGVFGFEILPNGNIVVAENGTDFITELKAETKEPIVKFKGDPTSKDGKMPNKHHHYRMIRKTPAGTYLVACSGVNMVREYDKDGKLIWECPKCGNRDQTKMNVARRTCGYIGTQYWNQGRTQEILDRYVHLDCHECGC
jgi:Zn-finger protein